MRQLATLTLLLLSLALALDGCNRQDSAGGPDDPGASGPDAGFPSGDASGCPPGTHSAGTDCIADEVGCDSDVPCPAGQQCAGGRCVLLPGSCSHEDECPVGYRCGDGTCRPLCPDSHPQCQRDAECAPSSLCLSCACVDESRCARPTADLSGAPYAAVQVLHLDEALGTFGQLFTAVVRDLRDGVQRCPPGSSIFCPLFETIADSLPPWGRTLVVSVADLADLIDDRALVVHSQMTFARSSRPWSYSGVDRWTLLDFSYRHVQVSKRPEDIPEIGRPLEVPFEASTVCGVLYVGRHKVESVLPGILTWLVDTLVELETCGNGGPCYHSLPEAVAGAIDCRRFQRDQPAVHAACVVFVRGLQRGIEDALESWLLRYSLMTLQGTASVESGGSSLGDGSWVGTLGDGVGVFKDFEGEWSARR